MKRFLSVLLSLCMIFGCTAFAVPMLDVAETANLTEESVKANLADDAELLSDYAKPGLNVWTGTESPYTFEGTTAGNYYAFGGAALVNNGSNTYMEYSGASSHFALNKTLPVIDKDRQVKVSFKAQADSAAAKSVFLVRNTMNNFNPSLGLIYTTFTTNWTTYTKDIVGSSQAVTNNSSIYTDNTQDIKQLILISQSNNSSNKIRIDDVSVVPYYKVTYNANGGTGAPADAWWLPATAGGKYTVSSTVPTKSGYNFLGWSIDGVNAVTEVTPANEDITLVALWEQKIAKPGINTWTGTADAFTFDNAVIGDFSIAGTTTLEVDGTNKYMKLNSSLAHFTLKAQLNEIPVDRKVKVSFNFNTAERRTIFLAKNKMNNASEGWGQKYITPTAANTWNNTYTQDVMGSDISATASENIKSVVIMAINSPINIDNVSVVPYYKVTYNANGGTGAPADAWWLPATAGGKYTVSATVPTKAGYEFAGWSLDGVNAVTEVTPANKDFTLVALWEKAMAKPGINTWTGTADAFTFDNAVIGDFSIAGTTTLEVDGTNKYMKLGSSLAHFTLKAQVTEIPADRKVKVSFNFNTAERRTIFLAKNKMNNASEGWGQKYITPTAANTWNNTYTQDIMGSDVSATASENIKSVVIMGINNPINIDNVSVVPYYKVTYDAKGGVVAPEDEWWLGTTYTVSSEQTMKIGYKFLGWSLDGVNVVTEVTPANEDINLVAVWEEDPNQEAFSYDFTSEVPGVADGAISIIAPSADYTTATIYFADKNGVLDGYTAFATVELAYGFGSYTVTGNRAFAEGATALNVVFSGEDVADATEVFTIPASHRMAENTPLYTYYVVSDTHLGGSANYIDYFYGQWQNPTGNMRTHALGNDEKVGDVFSNGADFVIVNGDLVNQGSYITDEGTDVGEERYWDVLDRYIDERLNIHGVPVFLTNGNHEFYQNDRMNTTGAFNPDRLVSAINGQVDYIEANYRKNVKIIRDAENEDALYYAANMYGTKYIFMSTPEMSEDRMTGTYTVSDKQLAFVEAQLAEANGNTVFVISHMPISGITNKDAVNALLAEYPNAVVFTSHTHEDLSVDKNRTVVGDMTTTFTTCDTGSTISTENPYSAGQYVEVYTDKIVIKARKFASESEFFGHAIYLIDTPDENAYDVAKPETSAEQEMKIVEENGVVSSGIRFKSIVTAAQRNNAVEYGFIVTRKTFLDELDGAELSFNLKQEGKTLFVYGVAYQLDTEGNPVVDKVIDIDDENGDVTFAAALVGMDNTNALHVNETFVARPYVKYTNGENEFIFYGNCEENSLVGVAEEVNTDELPDNYKTAVENIIALKK